MKILILGSGGREHAIAYKLSRSSLVSDLIVAPGNPGMKATLPGLRTKNISVTDLEGLLEFALSEKPDLTIVGPEASLSVGVVDLFQQNNLLIVGPTKAAGQLETSKAFAKKIMFAAGVPTADYSEFTNQQAALDFIIKSSQEKMVVKCDGLAAGKGVVVCQTKEEAKNAVSALMSEKLLGENVDHLIIEEFLEGTEVSAFALCDGEHFTFLGTACDHKRLRDGNLGPNTGGMGVFAPARCLENGDLEWMETHVFSPMLKAMKELGMPFSGILFAGLMKTHDGWKVLEFNVRLGDPETQVLLPLIEDDLIPWFKASAIGEIKKHQAECGQKNPTRKKENGVHVVMAASGYPGTEGVSVRLGDEISFDPTFVLSDSDFLFYAGVDAVENIFKTKGGRVLGITSLSDSAELARESAYHKISQIHFFGAQFRKDIGAKA